MSREGSMGVGFAWRAAMARHLVASSLHNPSQLSITMSTTACALMIGLGALCVSEIAGAEAPGCSPKPGKARWTIKTSIVNPIDHPITVDLAMLMGWDNPAVDNAMRKQLVVGRLKRQPGAEVKEGDIGVVEGFLQGAHCSG